MYVKALGWLLGEKTQLVSLFGPFPPLLPALDVIARLSCADFLGHEDKGL